MFCYCSLNHVLDECGGFNLDKEDFKPSGSVLQLHAVTPGLDLIVFNVRTVFDVKVSISSYSPSTNLALLSSS